MQNIKVALVQSPLIWENPNENIAYFEKMVQAVALDTALVVLPEMFTTGFTMKPEWVGEEQNGIGHQFLQDISDNKFVMGSLAIKDGMHFYNRLKVFGNKKLQAEYDKRHLFAFGNEHKHYTPGNKKVLVEIGHWNVQPFICYDLRFPVWCRSNGDVDVMIFVANWPEKRIHAWKNLLIARAIENQCYVIGVNRVGEDGNGVMHNGQSRVIDPMGEIILDAGDQTGIFETVLDYEYLTKVRRQFPFLKDADTFKIEY